MLTLNLKLDCNGCRLEIYTSRQSVEKLTLNVRLESLNLALEGNENRARNTSLSTSYPHVFHNYSLLQGVWGRSNKPLEIYRCSNGLGELSKLDK